MSKTRLEAFSDGVIAILITIMVLELKLAAGSDWNALRSMAPTFSAYVLSFVFLGIYWNNHHHMLHAAQKVNGQVGANGPGSLLAKAVGGDFKGKISILCYLTAIGATFVETRISAALYVAVALVWLAPDPRIERTIQR